MSNMEEIVPANPYLLCTTCQDWVISLLPEDNGKRTSTLLNLPCRHVGYKNVCPSWHQMDGCRCKDFLGYYPHGQPPKKENIDE